MEPNKLLELMVSSPDKQISGTNAQWDCSDWETISKNPNIQWNFIKNNLDKPWNWLY